jgi:predicted phage-related endonuclease
VQVGGPPPQVDGSDATKKALAKLYPKDDGTTIAMGGEFTELFDDLEGVKDQQKILEEQRNTYESQVKVALGDHSIGALQHGGQFSWKADKNGKRTLRMKGPKG